ncbi:hypothetical protein PFLUV_G00014420 [Perca fluviatilis]|uniref:Uncharacterized protein n=1 Tax=Perca fluviatilis TaxID=8168 RepID=A0A6A5FSU8_PERFL|nr:hypothetical protein PFLUV_G00014420 [Perca fluviatilis]
MFFFNFRMPKRKYKLYLEPNSTIKIPCARLKRHLDALPSTDEIGSSSADVETMSPSGHFELSYQSDPDDRTDQALPYQEYSRDDDDSPPGPSSHTADVETMSPSGHFELSYQSDPDDRTDQVSSPA